MQRVIVDKEKERLALCLLCDLARSTTYVFECGPFCDRKLRDMGVCIRGKDQEKVLPEYIALLTKNKITVEEVIEDAD